jgi:hypothetical protein
MKTYEQEYQKLTRWARKARAEADEKIKNLSDQDRGYDDRAAPILYKVNQDRNRRLRELKKKYGREAEITAQEPETEPVTKARNFSQLVRHPPI